jgi:hypothetical protein
MMQASNFQLLSFPSTEQEFVNCSICNPRNTTATLDLSNRAALTAQTTGNHYRQTPFSFSYLAYQSQRAHHHVRYVSSSSNLRQYTNLLTTTSEQDHPKSDTAQGGRHKPSPSTSSQHAPTTSSGNQNQQQGQQQPSSSSSSGGGGGGDAGLGNTTDTVNSLSKTAGDTVGQTTKQASPATENVQKTFTGLTKADTEDMAGSLKIHVKLALEVDIRIVATLKGDIAIGIL